MKAIGMIRGREGAHLLDVPMPETTQPDQALIRVRTAGVDGTDFNMLRYNLQDPPEGEDEIVIGHEAVGVVEAVGADVESLKPGDIVVPTVRRGCGICQPCLHNQSDMCMTGLYTERGIHKRNGYLTKYVVESEEYLVRVPPELAGLAVFTEPLSIAEKGIEQLRIIQSRFPWSCDHPEHRFLSPDWGGCKTALVLGSGPLGLLATSLLRLAGVMTFTADILPPESVRARLAVRTGAVYVDAREKTPERIVEECVGPEGRLDIVFEASGAAATALELISRMSRSSIYVMTGIPRSEIVTRIDAAQLVRQVVRQNQVIVGSVNSNRGHFESALNDIRDIEARFGLLSEMITHRYTIDEYERALDFSDTGRIKTVIDMESA